MANGDDTLLDPAGVTRTGPDLRWHDRLPLWLLIGAPIAALLLMVGVLVAGRGNGPESRPGAAPNPGGSSAGDATARANACLGGDGELNAAARSAQENAPITEAGAAAFAATVLRWLYTYPRTAPEQDPTTASMVLDGQTVPEPASGVPSRIDFTDGGYLVDDFDPVASTATVYTIGVAHEQPPEGVSDVEYRTYHVTLRTRDGRWVAHVLPKGSTTEYLKQNVARIQRYQGTC